MKRNLLALSAVVLAIAASSFTAKKTVDVYLVYKGSSFTQSDVNSYTQQSNQPTQVSGDDLLNWIKITDDNGIVTASEFSTTFASFDTNHNSTLNDEAIISGRLDKIDL